MGVVSSLGRNVDETASALREGRSGIRAASAFPPPDGEAFHAGVIPELPGLRGLSRGSALLARAAREAADQARLAPGFEADLILGTTLGGMEKGTAYMREVLHRSLSEANPALLADFLPASQPVRLALRLGLRGRHLVVNNACSSGTDALGIAFERIGRGEAHRILAGGYDPLCSFVATGFTSLMNVTKTRCRPFDRDRDGLVLGEGAALLVLEAEGEAARRGAPILGYVRGFGSASDAHHMTQPNPDGHAIGVAMAQALHSADLEAKDVGYVNLHGTGTGVNDLSEYRGLVRVFGEAFESLDVSSTKPLTGHTLGGAGALEAALCLIASRGGFLPPNLGFENPDPEMPGLKVVRRPTDKTFPFSMSNSLGFGGEASAVVLESASGKEA
jgi:3-oxoacyl-[acyl-carrier-protein] synthase II